jgi:hypothetical protein
LFSLTLRRQSIAKRYLTTIDPIRIQPPKASATLPQLPIDPIARLPVTLDWIEGWVEVILALLK